MFQVLMGVRCITSGSLTNYALEQISGLAWICTGPPQLAGDPRSQFYDKNINEQE